MAAFANTQGGVILLGVSDQGIAQGLDEQFPYEEWVMNIARQNVVPGLRAEFQSADIQGKKIGIIHVPKGKDKPYQTIDGKYLIRIGSTNRIATHSELMRLFQGSGLFHYDQIPVYGTSIQDLNFSSLDSYFRRYEITFSQEKESEKKILLINSDILTETGETSIAGLLIFGINPVRYLMQSGITFAHFKGTEITDILIDKQSIEGTLDFQIDTAFAVIKNNLLTPSVITGTRREDIRKMYPDAVFREVLTNAAVHRNYSISGSKIRVFMFDDRLEIISPGRLPNTVTIEKLKAGVSYAVNPIIVKFMENLRYMDQLGRGLPMVWREANRLKSKVEFKEIGEEFKVTLFFPDKKGQA